jgi:hypothetical protein
MQVALVFYMKKLIMDNAKEMEEDNMHHPLP